MLLLLLSITDSNPDWLACIQYTASCSVILISPLLLADTAAKVQAVKDKAKQANDTANDVLTRIRDLNKNLLGVKDNYKKLADDVAKTNAVVKDPSKNSENLFPYLFLSLWASSFAVKENDWEMIL